MPDEGKYILGFLVLVLSVSFVVIVYLMTKERSKYILSSNCGKPPGQFSVQQGKTSRNILNSCYEGNNQQCVFNASSLNDSINICNENIEICDRFAYNSEAGTMMIISKNATLSDNTSADIYNRIS